MVPNGWRLIALENIADPSAAIRYGVVQIGEHTENGIPIVPIKFIKSIDTAKLHRVSASIEAKYKNSRIHAGDVLISVKGTIGAVGIVPEGFSGNIAREIARIRPSVKYDSNYIAFQLQADHTQREIENLTVGTTRKEFSIHTLKKFEILVPPLNEQQKIVKILSTWEQAISATEKLLENSQQQKKALMQQLLTGKKRLLDENGMIFSSKWLSEKLEKICAISTGKKDVNEGNPNGIYPFFTCASEPTASDSYSYDCEALLIAGNGNLGKTHYIKGKFEAYQRTYILSKFDEKIQPLYLYQYILYWLMRDIEREKQHGAMPYIKLGLLQNFKIFIPSLTEQLKIIEVLSLADQEIETTLQKKLNCLKQEKKALMQQLLTGKKRVKVAA